MHSTKIPRNLSTADGDEVHVTKLLGTGSQGRVFEAVVHGKRLALKLYHHETAGSKQQALIERLVERGAPSEAFLWPRSIVTNNDDSREHGYLMPLREARFRSFEDLMSRRVTTGFRPLLTTCIQLTDAFHRLHVTGFCYRDISFGNVFFDPENGDVRICDNDNVDVNGSAPAGVLGTPRFMAPEIVRGEATPSTDTDRFSLAVLLFNVLMGGHPLDGALEARVHCLDMPAMMQLYGFSPLYIFHPTDAGNRPVKRIHDNPIIFQKIYPRSVMKLFETSFIDGLDSPGKRVLESVWRRVFIEARDLLYPCSRCHHHNFLEPSNILEGKRAKCWQCGAELSLPPRLEVNGSMVLLLPHNKVFAHHLGDRNNFDELIAEVVEHPSERGRVGLRNLTADPWTMTRTDGQTVDVPPGRAAGFTDGCRLHFGPATGEMHA